MMAVTHPSKIRHVWDALPDQAGEKAQSPPSGAKARLGVVLTRRPCRALLPCLAPVTFGAWGTCRSWWSHLPRGPWGENGTRPENTVCRAATTGSRPGHLGCPIRPAPRSRDHCQLASVIMVCKPFLHLLTSTISRVTLVHI